MGATWAGTRSCKDMRVVEVGAQLRERFLPGQRLAMQADVYYHGRNLSYGYMFSGGLAQYGLLGPEILAGDEGCYAIPVPDELGYAEVALTEPWACVEAAYAPRRRVQVKPGGTLWIVGRQGDRTGYHTGEMFAGGWPGRIVLTDVPAALAAELTAGGAAGTVIVVRDGLAPPAYASLAQAEAGGAFDDIVLLDADRVRLEALAPLAANRATINLAGTRPLGRAIALDVGRAHYDYVTYLGTRSTDLGTAYGEAHNRTDVRAGGVAWLVGAGGPMGRMHLQRLLEAPEGPRRIVVAETNAGRRAELELDFRSTAAARGIDLVIIDPREHSPAEFD